MSKKISVSTSKEEKEYLEHVKKYPEQVIMAHKDSQQEGFEYFESDEFSQNNSKYGSLIMDKFLGIGLKNIPKMIKIIAKYMPSMFRGKKECFTDLSEYLEQLDKNGHIKITKQEKKLIESYPNKELWNKLKDYAWENWNVIIGFTELPEKLIFKGKAVLFKYAIVCIQEMDKEKIDKAPSLDAGEEVQRVYNSLGLAVNDIANWLRENYGIACQSNHPLGGLVNTTPLAGKAGMGWQGHNGLLITPQFGQRQRIAPIFIRSKVFEFTDNRKHVWIEEFCNICRKCEKSCPTQAIYSKKKTSIKDVSSLGQTRTCIDRNKCYPQFNKTLGCSICMKVCPFSQGDNSYYKIKEKFNKK